MNKVEATLLELLNMLRTTEESLCKTSYPVLLVGESSRSQKSKHGNKKGKGKKKALKPKGGIPKGTKVPWTQTSERRSVLPLQEARALELQFQVLSCLPYERKSI
ncbi:hypothetical protein CFOL_v3_13686 [Cephalotus follicularis]|uniref:Uncharacterized protein n=1 Tax=Cephalotus follicularis TaxID=3775 RepID=A0A1Q3BQL4_CEPFO|nr:hypothetical protein CFOL_v3_13686 [Cephalotus follicularis]